MKAITPGTFDPITRGHIDVITRASKVFDEVIVAVAASPRKNPLFSLEERVELAQRSLKSLPTVRVVPFSGLLVDFAHEIGTSVVVKGLRAITDFEYEFQMSALNYQLDSQLETIFVMSGPEYMYLSSSIVREIASLHGEIDKFVTPEVALALRKKF